MSGETTLSTKRVVTYERVSSEDQKERETIKLQSEELARRLSLDPSLELVGRYIDDGVSSRIPLAERPQGLRLMRDAKAGLFEEIWVYKLDRLVRPIRDSSTVYEELVEELGVTVCSATQYVGDRLTWNFLALMADQELVTMRDRLVGGARQCAADGFYLGGVIPYGYRVKEQGRRKVLVPSEAVIWAGLTEAQVIERIFTRSGIDRWSCRQIAEEFNDLGIPTGEERPGLGRRKKKTQGLWRASGIRNKIINPVYRGELTWGRRNTKRKSKPKPAKTITARIEPLVSEDLWEAAQETLASNRLCPKNTTYHYLLHSKIQCGTCGLTYIGTRVHRTQQVWYRCNGYMTERGPIDGRCPAKAVKGEHLEPMIWSDIEAWLCNPGDILERLKDDVTTDAAAAIAEAERLTLMAALEENDSERQRTLHAFRKGAFAEGEFDGAMTEITANRTALEIRLSALKSPEDLNEEPINGDLLSNVRERLREGLTDEQREEIVQLLVRRVVVHTEILDNGKKQAKAVVEYRFPQGTSDVVKTRRGTGSSPPPENTLPATAGSRCAC